MYSASPSTPNPPSQQVKKFIHAKYMATLAPKYACTSSRGASGDLSTAWNTQDRDTPPRLPLPLPPPSLPPPLLPLLPPPLLPLLPLLLLSTTGLSSSSCRGVENATTCATSSARVREDSASAFAFLVSSPEAPLSLSTVEKLLWPSAAVGSLMWATMPMRSSPTSHGGKKFGSPHPAKAPAAARSNSCILPSRALALSSPISSARDPST
mmetsp:Transcript_36423/g.72213  ORF Transcript_36423/g.72213 Transcript_36423/m.72213 type:complete len:210 (-) Transcript_36423:167-796(-)